MTTTFHKHLLRELHMVIYQPGDLTQLNDRLLCEAVTVNENLRSLGYVLRPADIVLLAVSDCLYSFYEEVKELVPDVKAQPMYPGFPQQVMNMSEAEFRFHQAMHYFSTYDLELLTGTEVSQGWLPDYDGPARTEKDTTLLDASVVELVSEESAAITALRILMGRRERLTNPELELVLESAAACTADEMRGLKVRFKENLELLFPILVEKADRATALRTLSAICSHTGDVLRCGADYIRGRKYHLRTSEKKLLVRLLESYPVLDLRQNLMQSNNLRERNLMVLQHLDYNQYSRSLEHKEAVRALRNGELRSWYGVGEALLAEHSPKALTHLARRPGYMLRMLNRLLDLGYTQDAIADAMRPHAAQISGHLILRVLRTLVSRRDFLEPKYKAAINACDQKYRRESNQYGLDGIEFSYRSRKEQCVSEARTRRTCAENQYLNVPRRDAERTARDMVRDLWDSVEAKEKALALLRHGLEKQKALRGAARPRLISNANTEMDRDLIWCLFDPDYFRSAIARIEEELAPIRAQLNQAQAEADQWLQETLSAILETNQPLYDREIQKIDLWERERLSIIEKEYRAQLAASSGSLQTLAARKEAELAALEADHQRQLNMMRLDPQAVNILKQLLKAHFEKSSTPLLGKKVYLDLGQFDLAHSSLETEDRSKDGGYIRSGIAWKIPKNARYVRFFTYWNDQNRVDIDLHAGGVDLEGNSLHVGWNADFRSCGVVHSGDVTHSNAAEYIDIDLTAPIREIYANIDLFYGKYSFKGIQTCYVGMMAVDKIGAEVKHYNPANCFFTHELTQNTRSLFYGYVDVQNLCVRFVGQPNHSCWEARPQIEDAASMFSLKDYLDSVLEGQKVELVESAEDAEVVLTMGKSLLDNGLSLVDNNFFLEC